MRSSAISAVRRVRRRSPLHAVEICNSLSLARSLALALFQSLTTTAAATTAQRLRLFRLMRLGDFLPVIKIVNKAAERSVMRRAFAQSIKSMGGVVTSKSRKNRFGERIIERKTSSGPDVSLGAEIRRQIIRIVVMLVMVTCLGTTATLIVSQEGVELSQSAAIAKVGPGGKKGRGHSRAEQSNKPRQRRHRSCAPPRPRIGGRATKLSYLL